MNKKIPWIALALLAGSLLIAILRASFMDGNWLAAWHAFVSCYFCLLWAIEVNA